MFIGYYRTPPEILQWIYMYIVITHVQQIYLIPKSIHHRRFVRFPRAQHFVKLWNMLRSGRRVVGNIIVHMDRESRILWNATERHRWMMSLRNLKLNYRHKSLDTVAFAISSHWCVHSINIHLSVHVPLCKRHPKYELQNFILTVGNLHVMNKCTTYIKRPV